MLKYLITFLFLFISVSAAFGQNKSDFVSTRDMNRINWLEFKEVVPAKINTVILPTGTLEPHGVTANGADNIAPEAIARKIATDINCLIAPTLPYGMTGSMSNYPGAFEISDSVYRAFI